MLEIFFFFVPNTWRKWKKKSLEGENGVGAERNRIFKWNWSLLFSFSSIFFISTYKWLLMLTILSTKSCLLSYLSILLGAYKLVAYKKCKALIIIIIPILALYNINLLTELNWEWRQIKHTTVKKYCVICCIMVSGYFPWIFPPGQLPPQTTPPYKILPKKITLWTFAF